MLRATANREVVTDTCIRFWDANLPHVRRRRGDVKLSGSRTPAAQESQTRHGHEQASGKKHYVDHMGFTGQQIDKPDPGCSYPRRTGNGP
jgi:hypothetical protein